MKFIETDRICVCVCVCVCAGAFIYIYTHTYIYIQTHTHTQRRTPVSAGNMFQDLPRLRETADNTKRYI